MASSTLNIGIGYGCDLDLINAISQYSDFSNEAQDFSNIPISEWHGEHCASWVLSTCQKYGLDAFSVELGLLGSISGMLLLQSSKQDFCQMMGDVLGKILYQEIKLLKGRQRKNGYSRNMNSKADSYTSYTNDMQYYNSNQEDSNANRDTYVPFDSYSSPGYTPFDDYSDLYSHNSNIIPYSYNQDRSPGSQSYEESLNHDHYIYDESEVEVVDDLENINTMDLIRMDSYEARMVYQDNNFDLSDEQNPTCQTIKREYGENTIISPESEEFMDSNSLNLAKDSCGKVATTSKRQEREPKIWEFLIRLLADPRANPKLIRWDDEAKGTFFLEKPDIITYLWNSRSNKSPILYHNFARALRYHYKTGALFKVEERHLVYGCGPKAIEFFNKIKARDSNIHCVRN